MKKIPTLFEREFENHRIVRILPNISPDRAWVMAGDGVATIKWDGACCAVIKVVRYAPLKTSGICHMISAHISAVLPSIDK